MNHCPTPAVSRRALDDALEVHAAFGAVGSSALFGADAPGTTAYGALAGSPHARRTDHATAPRARPHGAPMPRGPVAYAACTRGDHAVPTPWEAAARPRARRCQPRHAAGRVRHLPTRRSANRALSGPPHACGGENHGSMHAGSANRALSGPPHATRTPHPPTVRPGGRPCRGAARRDGRDTGHRGVALRRTTCKTTEA